MPVTIKPCPERQGRNQDPTVSTEIGLLAAVSRTWYPHEETSELRPADDRLILDSCFSQNLAKFIPYRNGFVYGAIRAFEQDLHLVLRPDDIWLSILTQFSLYVNKNAQRLRSRFVTHQGQKELVLVCQPGSTQDQMTRLLQENVVDLGLRDWIMPNFTTTTKQDISVASAVMMGTLQKHVAYVVRGGCGFPSVTLLGDVGDWDKILKRLDRLPTYGEETAHWVTLLEPILKRMAATFYLPNSPELKSFWMSICYTEGEDGSDDVQTYSGWITAFTYWDERGEKIGLPERHARDKGKTLLELDGVRYPVIRPINLVDGIVNVPFTAQDHATGHVQSCTLIAGSVGMSATDKDSSTVVQPRCGWWMLEDSMI